MYSKYKIINSDVFAGINSLIEKSIDVAITSPPYWGQRDYGFEGQIGNESTYQEYNFKLVKIFNLLRKKMTDDGVFFLNIGDKYLTKYGKSSLGMIPFELAYYMVKDGWYLEDIIIWYKPNHMPSSIKNRFTNSYEPIFVFTKNPKNLYHYKKINDQNYSNILKVNLQPTPYKHVAVYPEKLIENLLKKVELKNNTKILDPFAGSGTTLKVVKDFFPNCNSIMIEYNTSYIDIIKNRCNLDDKLLIQKYDFIPYHIEKIIENEPALFENFETYDPQVNKKGFVLVFNQKQEYMNFITFFKNKILKNHLNNTATCFVGCKEFDIDLIHQTAQLNRQGWVIRNLIVVEENNKWFPIFMIVDDNKKVDYVFNYKNLELKSKNGYSRNWYNTNFVGYKVTDSISKIKRNGQIVEIIKQQDDGFPVYAIVRWENGSHTKEFIISSPEEINKNLQVKRNKNYINIIENKEITKLNKNYIFNNNKKNNKHLNNKEIEYNGYNGKYKNEKRINWGASPGARASIEEEYFSLKRLYDVDQAIVSDYLNIKRNEIGYTKTDITNYFPRDYKHTIGHWMRKDFGGSIPTPEDWEILTKILNIDQPFTNYVNKTALKLQTVRHGEFKMPDDFININDLIMFKKLLQ